MGFGTHIISTHYTIRVVHMNNFHTNIPPTLIGMLRASPIGLGFKNSSIIDEKPLLSKIQSHNTRQFRSFIHFPYTDDTTLPRSMLGNR